MSPAAVNACNSLVHSIASQSESSWSIFELFKAKFTGGQSWSSSKSWAISDLHGAMMSAGDNAPVFISAFWDGCAQIQTANPEIGSPDDYGGNQIYTDQEVTHQGRKRN